MNRLFEVQKGHDKHEISKALDHVVAYKETASNQIYISPNLVVLEMKISEIFIILVPVILVYAMDLLV